MGASWEVRKCVAALLGAVLLCLSYSTSVGLALTPLALAPLAWGLTGLTTKRRLAYILFSLGIYQGWVHIWAVDYSWPGWVVLSVLKVLPFCLLLPTGGRVLGFACSWTVAEWINSLGALGHTGGSLSHNLASVPVLIQSASWTGPWFLSFLLAFWGAALAARCRASLSTALLFSLAIWGHGYLTLSQPRDSSKALSTAVVQGCLKYELKFSDPPSVESAEMLLELTTQAARKSELVIWSETAFPWCGLRWDPNWSIELGGLARRTQTTLILASLEETPEGFENCLHCVLPTGEFSETYGKQKRVPFVEYLPWERLRRWPPFDRVNRIVRGSGSGLFSLDKGPLGLLVCWESMTPITARERTVSGAELLVSVTNDEWFRGDDVAETHLAMAVFRAVENGRPVAQAANTGYSALIDDRGRVQNCSPLGIRTVIVGQLHPESRLTFYTRWGDWFPLVTLGICTLVLYRERRPSGDS